ncbi:MAG: ABC transporter permease, partial [Waddliaceae bacterium]
MFELSVAFKYLMPKWRQLSVSIISIISILVIALVVWLIVVFFSVTHGLEKSWVQKLIALTAPVRVTPTEEYYKSYYYLADSISENSDYTLKSIGEKLASRVTESYDPDFDEEPPLHWPTSDLDNDGNLKDLTKLAFASISKIEGVPGLEAKEYELTVANVKLQLLRRPKTVIPLSDDLETDQNRSYISQVMYIGSYDSGNPNLPKIMLPVTKDDVINLIEMASVDSDGALAKENHQELRERFHNTPNLQDFQLANEIALGNLNEGALNFWTFDSAMPVSLPSDPKMGEAILLPKSYKDNGVLIGDRGYISYNAPTASSIQEQRTPIFVAGFYDPGILPLGGKIVLANQHITSMIRSAYPQDENPMSNGINVRFANLNDADLVKAKLQLAFDEAGISKYWRIETFREFEFTKDLLQQLRSERNLFTLISAVIIIVACSNIVSMLIILVNDKKMEIGILRSMGASSQSIVAI